ncbi:MAG: hypothetical protein EA397_04485 [Deltaproteobacteria bacterium]|nr:MAG: hypothetical protein EA397_04485 [Deltaproteobacteria bacterium]
MTFLVALLGLAHARPTEGGQFGYQPDDVVVHYDAPGGKVRVHYAVEGPSVTLLADDRGTGVPDYVEQVGETVEHAWELFVLTGFRGPLFEADVGLGPLGGSEAFDVYLVDFGGGADGAFRVDGCVEGVCAGHLLIENDFFGYGYPSLTDAVDTLASHELFHAVQAAYTRELSVWASEGTAVWAQRLFDEDNVDFLRYAQAYLDDSGRSLDTPPVGPVPRFAYATGLWFDFVGLRYGDGALVDLMERLGESPGRDEIDVVGELLADHGEAWPEVWRDFGVWNLATAARAGEIQSYPYADALREGVPAFAEGGLIAETRRFFPLATTYYRVDHRGGPLRVATAICEAGLEVQAFPVQQGAADGAIHTALDPHLEEGAWTFGDESLSEGGYWVRVGLLGPAEQSVRTEICLGQPRWCAIEPECAVPGPDGGADVESGCTGCATVASSPSLAWLLIALGWLRRRPLRSSGT